MRVARRQRATAINRAACRSNAQQLRPPAMKEGQWASLTHATRATGLEEKI